MGRLDTDRSVLGNLLACFKCCGSTERNNHTQADHVLQPLNLFNPSGQTTSIDQLIADSRAARSRLYQKLGSLEAFSLADAENHAAPLVGAPRWPSQKQSFQVIRRPNGNVIIVSDGLSDPFDDLQADANVNGWGLEFFVETPAAEVGKTPSELKASWQFQLLYTVCSLAAGHGGIRHIIDDMQLLSTEAEGVHEAIPQDDRKGHVNRANRVGALLGLTDTQPTSPTYIPEKIEGMPLTDVKLVNLKLITLAELKLITELGAEGRRKLSELFEGNDRLVSSLQRPSVL